MKNSFVNIFVCGDVVNMFADGPFIESSLCSVIKGSDYAICNFEGSLVPEIVKFSSGIFQMNSTLSSLKDAGFKMLLLANNHITDYEKKGLMKTITEAKKYSFDVIGAGFSIEEVYRPKILKINRIKFGLINICEAQVGQYVNKVQDHGYAWLGHPCVDKLIESTKCQVDHLLLFVHTGLEHYNLPLAEYRELFKRYCDLGADCVIASHPHIAQGIERYNDSLIFYSLGNFFFPRTENACSIDIENQSFSVMLQFDETKIDYYPIFHKIDNLTVSMVPIEQSMIKLEVLNSNLLEPNYSRLINEVYYKAYNDLCYKLYLQALMGTDSTDSVITSFKYVIRYLFFRKKYWIRTQKLRYKLHLHLIQNETYRYLTQHVLIQKIGEKNH